MIRRPPRSTLFPTRRSSDLGERLHLDAGLAAAFDARHHAHRRARALQLEIRSEEHTSELQSHLNLVCRLLLEKKKRNPKVATGQDLQLIFAVLQDCSSMH